MSTGNEKQYQKNRMFGLVVASILIAGSLFAYFYSVHGNAVKAITSSQDPYLGATSEVSAALAKEGSSPSKQITLIAQDAEIEIAPGKTAKVWTFNGTMPGPTLRFTEGDNVTIKFINKTPIPHTIHFHGNHDDINDGVYPQIQPNGAYLYNITAAPAGALMYHCHAHPTSLHIRMGMYGALIVDPKDEPLHPAREFVMVMGEYDTKDIMKFEPEYYPINGYSDQYLKNPLKANSNELVRMYVINIGTTIPYQFHLHSTTFKAYPSGLLSNKPIHAQTMPVGPGDATIIEAKWKYPGTYLFHSHGIQEERGNMGEIVVSETNNKSAANTDTNHSISMFDWQYWIQKELQRPKVVEYDLDDLLAGSSQQQSSDSHGVITHDNTTTFVQPTANATNTEIPKPLPHGEGNNNNGSSLVSEIRIIRGASNPSGDRFYDPSPAAVKKGSTITWINNDTVPHTATSGNPESGPDAVFDSGIIGPGNKMEMTVGFNSGTYDYYCSLHPYMRGQLTLQD